MAEQGKYQAFIDSVVHSYLVNRDYKNSAQSLKGELDSKGLTLEAGSLGSTADVVWAVHHGSNPQAFHDTYNAFVTWVCSSLDTFKPELSALLFPIFAQFYCALIRLGKPDEADVFFKRWYSEHAMFYQEELQQLSVFTSLDQLNEPSFVDDNQFVRILLRESKYIVPLSRMTFELLQTFLVQEQLFMIVAVLNDKLNLQIQERIPSSTYQPPILPGWDQVKQARAHMDEPFRYGVFGQESTRNAVPNDEQPFYKAAWRNVVRLRPDKFDASRERAAPLLNALSPTVLMATFTNTYDMMTCCRMNQQVTQIAAGFNDSAVRVWRLDNQKLPEVGEMGQVAAIPTPRGQVPGRQVSLKRRQDEDSAPTDTDRSMVELVGHSRPVFAVTHGLDDHTLLSAAGDNTIRLWDLRLASVVERYRTTCPVWDLAFNPFGYYFATAQQDCTARIYCTDRPQPVRMFVDHLSDVNCVKFHPNGSYLATGSDDKTVRLWDMQQASCVRVLPSHPAPVSCLDVSPDGRYLAAGTTCGRIILWDMATGRPIARCMGHKGVVHSLAFSPDGKALHSGGQDCTVRTWDVTAEPQDSELVISAAHVFMTKNTPVYDIGCTRQGLVHAAGPFTVSHIGLETTIETEDDAATTLGLQKTVAVPVSGV